MLNAMYTHGQFFGSAGAGVLIRARSTGRYLLMHRSRQVNEPGTWGLLGGAIDPGEDPREAAEREASEEAGASGVDVEDEPFYVFESGSFRFYDYLGHVDDEFEPLLNWESQGYAWVTLDELPKPLHPGIKSLLPALRDRERTWFAGRSAKLYHASHAPLPVGEVLSARSAEALTPSVVDAVRPRHMARRNNNFFMAENVGCLRKLGVRPDELVYEVEPVGPHIKGNFKYVDSIISRDSYAAMRELTEGVRTPQAYSQASVEDAESYWAGRPFRDEDRYGWFDDVPCGYETLSKDMRVKRYVGRLHEIPETFPNYEPEEPPYHRAGTEAQHVVRDSRAPIVAGLLVGVAGAALYMLLKQDQRA